MQALKGVSSSWTKLYVDGKELQDKKIHLDNIYKGL